MFMLCNITHDLQPTQSISSPYNQSYLINFSSYFSFLVFLFLFHLNSSCLSLFFVFLPNYFCRLLLDFLSYNSSTVELSSHYADSKITISWHKIHFSKGTATLNTFARFSALSGVLRVNSTFGFHWSILLVNLLLVQHVIGMKTLDLKWQLLTLKTLSMSPQNISHCLKVSNYFVNSASSGRG